METFYSITSGSRKTHLTKSENNQPVCGEKLGYAQKRFKISFVGAELKEVWDDGFQPVKVVIVEEYLYCKRCLKSLKKSESLETYNHNQQNDGE